MLIYRIDYETIDSKGPRVAFAASKDAVGHLKRAFGTSLSKFKFERVNVPTGRYELVGWLNKTFGSKAQTMREPTAAEKNAANRALRTMEEI